MLLVAALCPGCDAALGIEQLPADRAPEQPTCNQCVRESCDAVRNECLDDPLCRETYACLTTCPLDDVVCRLRCEKSRAAGAATAKYRALDGCRRTNCTDECYGVGGFGRLVDERCGCTDANCELFVRSCIRSGESRGELIGGCERRFACFGERALPIDPEDAVSCSLSRNDGDPEVNALRFCWQSATCGTCPMPGGGMQACAGKYQWATPIPDAVSFTLTVTNQQGRVIQDAAVAACAAPDCDACAAPVRTGRTNEVGAVKLVLPTFGLGFRGCFQLTASGYLDTLWYPGRPLTRDEAILRVPMVTQGEMDAYGVGLGAPILRTHGQILIATRDCIVAPASGITLEAMAGPESFAGYLRGGDTIRTGTTDGTGRGAIVNASPGPVTVIGRNTFGEFGRATVRARPGWMTGLFLFPNVGSI